MMYSYEESILVDVSPEAVWSAWSDVKNWNKWDKDIEWSLLESEFKNGGKISLKPRSGPIAHGIIENCEHTKSFTVTTPIKPFGLTLATLQFHHYVEKEDSRLKIIHRIEVSGPLACVFWYLIGKKIAKELNMQLASFVDYVQKETHSK